MSPSTVNIVPVVKPIVNIAGKDYYLGPHGTNASHVAYDRLVAEYLSAGRQIIEPERAPATTVVEVLAAFWRHCKTYYLPGQNPLRKFFRALRIVSPTFLGTYRFRVLFGGTRPEATLYGKRDT